MAAKFLPTGEKVASAPQRAEDMVLQDVLLVMWVMPLLCVKLPPLYREIREEEDEEEGDGGSWLPFCNTRAVSSAMSRRGRP